MGKTIYQLLLAKLPTEVKVTYRDINEALNHPFFQSLTNFYNNAEGDNEAEKLEKMLIVLSHLSEENVEIMSIHKSKGLGAEHVFMIGLIEGIIPNKAKGNDTIESQRRLFYVGMTRAKKNLHLISSINLEGKYAHTVNKEDFTFHKQTRVYKGKASRFIEELN